MPGEYLLDSNAVIALLGADVRFDAKFGSASILVPAIVVGELYFGAFRSTRVQQNVENLERWVATSAVLVCDVATAREYGEIKHELRVKGRPIPDNDIWIAALARQHDLPLVTLDAHFAEVARLRMEGW